jgi:hypothetical protein
VYLYIISGYVVSDFAQDGFALLRGDRIFIPGSTINQHLRGATVGGSDADSPGGDVDVDAGDGHGGGFEKQRDF